MLRGAGLCCATMLLSVKNKIWKDIHSMTIKESPPPVSTLPASMICCDMYVTCVPAIVQMVCPASPVPYTSRH